MFTCLPHRRAAILVAAAAVVSAVAIPAQAATGSAVPVAPIQPGQYFSGEVFGVGISTSSGNDVIGVDCAVGATSGYAYPGQYVEVVPVSTTTGSLDQAGYTGVSGDSVTVTLSTAISSMPEAWTVGTVTTYDTQLPIPTTLSLPCGGAGTAVFAPEPNSTGAKSAVNSIQFESGAIPQ